MIRTFAVWGMALLLLTGCGGGEPSVQGEEDSTATSTPPAASPSPPPAPTLPPASPESTREPAKVGVGIKGQGYGPGPVATPIRAMFRTKEMLAFTMIKQPMDFYQIEHGYFPKTQEEFMKEIIEKNRIKLPELPPGKRYVYDVEKAASMRSYDLDDPPLMVETAP